MAYLTDGYEYKGKKVGGLSWVDVSVEETSRSQRFKHVFNEGKLSDVLVNRYLPAFGIFMLAYGLPVFLFTLMDSIWLLAFSLAMSISLLLTLYILVGTHVAMIDARMKGEDPEDCTVDGIRLKTLAQGVYFLPLVFIQPVIYLVRYLKQGKDGYIKNQVEKTFKKNEEQAIEMLNHKVELENGYITYFNNILTTTPEGVYPTIKHRKLDETKEEDRLKGLLVEGEELTTETLPNYFKLMYNDYVITVKDNNIKELKQGIKDNSIQREKELEYIKKNKKDNEELGKDIEEYLTQTKRENRIRKITEEVGRELKDLSKELQKQEENINQK